ncbi:hypothetical protein CPLU01_10178 [Colletotrichum plurivorum]|uniref:Uncharacterized protein n=1 Tax=Colletotrichum plurivorum TaxID=2175906 RepID=A0A8H6K6X0_9PEZI|nr:hypothetical protein CPLU01_10178 [Colletotrichum plurivorum]
MQQQQQQQQQQPQLPPVLKSLSSRSGFPGGHQHQHIVLFELAPVPLASYVVPLLFSSSSSTTCLIALTSRDHPVVKTFSNLLNSVHHPYAGARCSAAPGGSADSAFDL